jgi:hypothetical protein
MVNRVVKVYLSRAYFGFLCVLAVVEAYAHDRFGLAEWAEELMSVRTQQKL